MNTEQTSSPVCHVFATANRGPQKGSWESIGVFISPQHVLTTLHSVRGMHQIEVVDSNGRVSRSRFLQPVASNPAMDVAIIKLLVPIGKEPARIPEGPFVELKSGLLRTLFQNKAAAHLVVMDCFHHALYGAQPKDTPIVDFATGIQVIPGYSGSPIMASDGRTLVSLVTSHHPSQQAHLMQLVNAMQQVSGIALEGALPLINFSGPNPRHFHDWIQKAAKELRI